MLEAQVLGMVGNPDEDAFPVVWSAESKWDGFYTEIDASWDWVNDGSGRVSVANWSITGRRLTSGTGDSANLELTNYLLVRTNGHGTTSGSTINTLIPPAWTDFEQRSVTMSTPFYRYASNGQMTFSRATVGSATTQTVGIGLPASGYYGGACSLEFRADDDVWYPWVGVTVPAGSAGKWRMSSDCFRIEPSDTVGSLKASVYNGTSWETTEFQGNHYTAGAHMAVGIAASTTAWLAPFILRNSPDCVVLSTVSTATNLMRVRTTITLRRGAHHAEISMRSPSGRPGVRFTTATASTALATATAGVVGTSNDANGNRLVLMSASSCLNDTTNGRVYVDDATANAVHVFGVGVEYDGTSAVTGNSAASLLAQFLVPGAYQTRVVAR